ncbi:MAG: hypothetical protein WAN93_05805, partial [Solirubrobacteraceae bacterium]
NGDPVNQTDLTGAYVENDYVLGLGMEQNIRAIEQEAAREAAVRKEAEERAREAAIQAKFAAQMAAELAEAEARNLWDAEAAAGPPAANTEETLSYTFAGTGRAQAAGICQTWPYCSSLQTQTMTAHISAKSCTVTFAGVTSSCEAVLARAKKEYDSDNSFDKKVYETLDLIDEIYDCVKNDGDCPDFGSK